MTLQLFLAMKFSVWTALQIIGFCMLVTSSASALVIAPFWGSRSDEPLNCSPSSQANCHYLICRDSKGVLGAYSERLKVLFYRDLTGGKALGGIAHCSPNSKERTYECAGRFVTPADLRNSLSTADLPYFEQIASDLKSCELQIFDLGLPLARDLRSAQRQVTNRRLIESGCKEDRLFARNRLDEKKKSLIDLCHCLEKRKIKCSDHGKFFSFWETSLAKILEQEVADSPLESQSCFQSRVDSSMGHLLTMLNLKCEEQAASKEMIDLLKLPPHPDRCEQVSGFDANGCVMIESCSVSKGVAPKKEVRCYPNLASLRNAKDPLHLMDLYGSAALPMFIDNSNVDVTFGMNNCHGVASTLSGQPINSLAIDTTSQPYFMNTFVETSCKSTLENFLKSRKNLTIGEFSIEPGGASINMNHNPSCSEDSCGTVHPFIQSCNSIRGELTGGVWIEDMCVKCWKKLYLKKGFRPLEGLTSSWNDLSPGCVLTQDDHSITLIHKSGAYCTSARPV
jgi:hypothetical protein